MVDLASVFGTRHPIVQAPMAGVQGSALAIAVGRAGALGSLPAAMLTPDALRAELAALRDSGLPHNVNFFAHVAPEPDATREAAWREELAPYYREYGVDPASIPSGPGRVPFSADTADVLAEFAPPVVSFHFGLPGPALLDRVRSWDAVVMSTATTVDEARWLARHGVDVVIAQGLEAGGHRGHFLAPDLAGQLPTLDLVAAITVAVDLPVLATGGIADVEGVRAALGAGAAGVQVGSALLCCDEATTSDRHRAALQSPAVQDTAITNIFTGRPARGIANRAIREVGGLVDGRALSDLAPEFPLAGNAMAPLRAAAEASGSADFTPLWVGEGAAPRTGPAASIIAALAEGLGGAGR
ncbi:MAG TPA: nitronate monooxygenase [Propionibacterium sp.]|nr:nitronate monooxygenase [Propionibacterium sp.]